MFKFALDSKLDENATLVDVAEYYLSKEGLGIKPLDLVDDMVIRLNCYFISKENDVEFEVKGYFSADTKKLVLDEYLIEILSEDRGEGFIRIKGENGYQLYLKFRIDIIFGVGSYTFTGVTVSRSEEGVETVYYTNNKTEGLTVGN